MLTVLDLFSGIGGFSLGLERTGGFKTVAFCEIDSYCRNVLSEHWPWVHQFYDITSASFPEGYADVICGGFPCQDVSIAGRRSGITGARSGLYRYLVGAIRMVQPKYAILENVANLLADGMGSVLGDLADEGYDAEWDCISANDVGLPTLRRRVWIIAFPLSSRRQGRVQHIGAFGVAPAASAQRSHEAIRARIALEHDFRGVRADHGFSVTMERRRIGQYGNAVVPQIPEIIGHAILQAEISHSRGSVGG